MTDNVYDMSKTIQNAWKKSQDEYKEWLAKWNSRSDWREDIKHSLASKGLTEELAEQCAKFIDHQHFPQLTDEENRRVKAWAAMFVEHELPFIGVMAQPWHILILAKGFVYGAAFTIMLEEDRKDVKSISEERRAMPNPFNLEYLVNWARAKYFNEKI